jgi:hypothetical protein
MTDHRRQNAANLHQAFIGLENVLHFLGRLLFRQFVGELAEIKHSLSVSSGPFDLPVQIEVFPGQLLDFKGKDGGDPMFSVYKKNKISCGGDVFPIDRGLLMGDPFPLLARASKRVPSPPQRISA